MFSPLVHLILSLSISYPYLIKFDYFADNSQEGVKHQMRGVTQVQEGMHDFPDNSIVNHELFVESYNLAFLDF
jgi:hypothetical protein